MTQSTRWLGKREFEDFALLVTRWVFRTPDQDWKNFEPDLRRLIDALGMRTEDGEQVDAETNERAEYLRSMPYADYLRTEHWQTIRECVLRRAGYACQLCGDDGLLNVHHRTYARRGAEHPHDLTALCADCHRLFHEHKELAE